jgi:hypothetical protein
VVCLDDGRVEMDTNVVERAIRPITVNRNYPYVRIMRRLLLQFSSRTSEAAALPVGSGCRYRT